VIQHATPAQAQAALEHMMFEHTIAENFKAGPKALVKK
jgi:hypothetical protein